MKNRLSRTTLIDFNEQAQTASKAEFHQKIKHHAVNFCWITKMLPSNQKIGGNNRSEKDRIGKSKPFMFSNV